MSPLICIFRVAGTDLDIDAILNGVALRPYRIERSGVGRAKTNALHYEISDREPMNSSELATAIDAFLTRHGSDILFIRQMHGVDSLVLDIGLMTNAEEPMRTLSFEPSLLKSIADLGLSLEFSAYGSAEASA